MHWLLHVDGLSKVNLRMSRKESSQDFDYRKQLIESQTSGWAVWTSIKISKLCGSVSIWAFWSASTIKPKPNSADILMPALTWRFYCRAGMLCRESCQLITTLERFSLIINIDGGFLDRWCMTVTQILSKHDEYKNCVKSLRDLHGLKITVCKITSLIRAVGVFERYSILSRPSSHNNKTVSSLTRVSPRSYYRYTQQTDATTKPRMPLSISTTRLKKTSLKKRKRPQKTMMRRTSI